MTKSKAFTATASGDTTILAAAGVGKAYSFRYVYHTDTAVGVKFISGVTDVTGVMPVGANAGVASSIWLHCGGNEALKINLDGAATKGGGHIEYEVNDVS